MPMTALRISAVAFCLCSSVLSHAEEKRSQRNSRFFFDEPEADEVLTQTGFDGSLVLTTLYFSESSQPFDLGGGTPGQNASGVTRFFTDLRARLDVEHIKGGRWHLRTDIRGRLTPGACRTQSRSSLDACTRFQSGSLSGNEIDFNQFYFTRSNAGSTWSIGRQFVSELTYTKVDGIRYDHKLTDKWKAIGFAGLYPALISRDIRSDYPVLNDASTRTRRRSLPVTGGGGVAYEYGNYFGSFGGTVIAPLTKELGQLGNGAGGTGRIEKFRVFANAQGHAKLLSNLDVHHSAIFDVRGPSGPGFTNLGLGLHFRPFSGFRTYLQATRVSTDILNVNAQSQLETPGNQTNVVQNNVAVRRISQESARLGATVSAFENRFELSSIVTARRRPRITLISNAGNPIEFGAAKAVEVTVHAVDKYSFAGLRIGGYLTHSLGIGKNNLNRGRYTSVGVDARRSFLHGKAEFDGSVTYLISTDETRSQLCDPQNIETCYGSAATSLLGLTANGFYRFSDSWFVLGGLNLATQASNSINIEGQRRRAPSILMTTFFSRLAYRF